MRINIHIHLVCACVCAQCTSLPLKALEKISILLNMDSIMFYTDVFRPFNVMESILNACGNGDYFLFLSSLQQPSNDCFCHKSFGQSLIAMQLMFHKQIKRIYTYHE